MPAHMAANPEDVFEAWYNGGERRTFAQVAAEFGIGYATVRRYAEDGDWLVRAADLDAAVQREVDQRTAARLGRHRTRLVEAMMTIQSRFFLRLPPELTDDDGVTKPNPAYLPAEAISMDVLERSVKIMELLTGNPTYRLAIDQGGAGDVDLELALKEMQDRIIAAELATAGDLPAIEQGGSSGDDE